MPNWPELSSVAILSCGNEVRELEVLNLCGKCPATKRRFYYQEKVEEQFPTNLVENTEDLAPAGLDLLVTQ